MGWLNLARVDEAELIDDPAQPLEDLTVSMGDVAQTNRWFGGTGTVLRHVANLLKTVPNNIPIRILDIGTGSADIPCALIDWGRRVGRSITVVAVDNSWKMLQIAREKLDGASVVLAQADATTLPFAPKSFDIAVCALAFHHLGFETSARVLAAMDRLTTRGFIVTDLRRDRLSLALVHTGLTLVRSHPITRHDGPASVRRAFTLAEYRKMVALAGVSGIHIHTHWYYRVALVKQHDSRDNRDDALLQAVEASQTA